MQSNKGKKHFLKNILTLLTGTTIAQAIPIGISPILTRLYSPEDFGLLALYLSIISIISVAATARYELAIMLPENDKEARNLLALSILVATFISIFLFILVFIFGREIAILLGNIEIYSWLYFIPLSILLSGAYQSFSYWSNRNQMYRRLAANRITQSSTTAGLNMVIGIIKSGPFGLIFGHIVGQSIATLALIIKSKKTEKISFNDFSINEMKNLAKRYDQFPKVSVWSALLNSGSAQMPIFILSAFFSSTIVGWYSLAHRVLKMPMSVLGSAVGQVFFQTTSKIKQNSEKLRVMTYKSYLSMLFIGLIPISAIFAFGDVLFSFVFGDQWGIAGNYARILSVWLLLVFVSSPLSLLFTVMEKEGVAFLFNLVIFISRVISLLVGAIIFKSALITVILFAISGIVFWLWHCVYILKLVKIPYWKSILITISVISFVLGISLWIRFIILNNIW